jgi:hypothetical protein
LPFIDVIGRRDTGIVRLLAERPFHIIELTSAQDDAAQLVEIRSKRRRHEGAPGDATTNPPIEQQQRQPPDEVVHDCRDAWLGARTNKPTSGIRINVLGDRHRDSGIGHVLVHPDQLH